VAVFCGRIVVQAFQPAPVQAGKPAPQSQATPTRTPDTGSCCPRRIGPYNQPLSS
jgi:hypothetical protein